MLQYQLSHNVFNCLICQSRCDGKSLGVYDFEQDLKFSEAIENKLINIYNREYPLYTACKSAYDEHPDIVIKDKRSNQNASYLEVKVQARTFMKVNTALLGSGLHPSVTVGLNVSDLRRYVDLYYQEGMPIYIIWCLMQRPCVTGMVKERKVFCY